MSKNNSRSIITVINPSFSIELKYLVDKIDFNPMGLIAVDDLLEHWNLLNLIYNPVTTSNNQSGITCNNINFLYQPYSSKYFYKITSNPSHFKSMKQYKSSLNNIIPESVLSRMEIQTLDIACDLFNKSYDWINERFIVTRKQSIERIVDGRGDDSTRYIGKYPEVIKFYNKKVKVLKSKRGVIPESLKLKGDWSRVEVTQNSIRKLPTKIFGEIEDSLLNLNYNPFKAVIIQDYKSHSIDLKNIKRKISRRDINEYDKSIKFRSLVKVNGLHHTRRYLSKNDNFKRDYSRVYSLRDSICLGDYYHEGIKLFLEEGV